MSGKIISFRGQGIMLQRGTYRRRGNLANWGSGSSTQQNHERRHAACWSQGLDPISRGTGQVTYVVALARESRVESV